MTAFRLLFSTMISLGLFFGGIIILTLGIPFWSAALGVAATQIGIVFLIFTYEQLSRNALLEDFRQKALHENSASSKRLAKNAT